MKDAAGPRETNRTAIEFVSGLPNLLELDSLELAPVEHYYSGGGCSLFQTSWLKRFVRRTPCYDPFYWEDVEWGVWARSAGLMNLHVPRSVVQHVRQATVRRFYHPDEVSRIFERNRLQFQLRCHAGVGSEALRERLMNAPDTTLRELLSTRRLASMLHARALLT